MWGEFAVEHLGVCKLNKPTAFDRNCCINNVGVSWQCRHLSHQLFGAGYPQLCGQRILIPNPPSLTQKCI